MFQSTWRLHIIKSLTNYSITTSLLENFNAIVPNQSRSKTIESLISQFISENKKGVGLSMANTDSKIVKKAQETNQRSSS